MSLTYPKGALLIPDGTGGPTIKATQKWWLTEDRSRLVPDGHPDARFLYTIPGRHIPLGEAKRFGLLKESKPQATKESRPERTKAR